MSRLNPLWLTALFWHATISPVAPAHAQHAHDWELETDVISALGDAAASATQASIRIPLSTPGKGVLTTTATLSEAKE